MVAIVPALLAPTLLVALTGCTGDIEQALVISSPACQLAGELFDSAGSDDRSERLTELAGLVPEELTSTVEQLAGVSAASVPASDVVRLQEWAVTTCGATIAVPAPTQPGTPQTLVSLEGDVATVAVTGATTPDEAVQFCEDAAARHSSAASVVHVVVFDTFGVLLADDSSGQCSIALDL